MDYSAFDEKKLWTNLARLVVYFALILITPWLAEFTSPWFVQISYNQLTDFFVMVMLTLFWLMEIGLVMLAEFFLKKYAIKRSMLPQELKEKKEITVLPLKNVLMISGIVLGCLLVVGLQIGIEVKPFFDMGKNVEKGSYGYITNIGPIIMAVVKCMWILMILKAGLAVGEGVFGIVKDKSLQTMLIWALGTAFMMAFALYDIFVWNNEYALTYLLFYLLFPLIYYLTGGSKGKFYLIILFIYIF